MAQGKSERLRDKEVNRKFEKEQRRLNRRWTRNAVSGIVLLVVIVVALQFTPYRNFHLDILDAAKNAVKKFTSGSSGPVEPNPKYW